MGDEGQGESETARTGRKNTIYTLRETTIFKLCVGAGLRMITFSTASVSAPGS